MDGGKRRREREVKEGKEEGEGVLRFVRPSVSPRCSAGLDPPEDPGRPVGG